MQLADSRISLSIDRKSDDRPRATPKADKFSIFATGFRAVWRNPQDFAVIKLGVVLKNFC